MYFFVNGKYCLKIRSAFPGKDLYFWVFEKGHGCEIEFLKDFSLKKIPFDLNHDFDEMREILPMPNNEWNKGDLKLCEKVILAYFGRKWEKDENHFLKNFWKFSKNKKNVEKRKLEQIEIFQETEEMMVITDGKRKERKKLKSEKKGKVKHEYKTVMSEQFLLSEEGKKESNRFKKKKKKKKGLFMCCGSKKKNGKNKQAKKRITSQ